MSMALVMSQMPDVWRKVLAEHVPDQARRCRECRSADGSTAAWPCQTYRIAQEAKWVADGNLPGTGPHGPGPSASPYLSRPEPEPARAASWSSGASSWSSPPDADPLGGSWTGSLERSALDGPSWDLPSYDRSFPEPSWDRSAHRHAPVERSPLDRSPLDGPGLPPGPIEPGPRTGRRRAEDTSAPYGSTLDAPYGSSFGVDDGRHSRW